MMKSYCVTIHLVGRSRPFSTWLYANDEEHARIRGLALARSAGFDVHNVTAQLAGFELSRHADALLV